MERTAKEPSSTTPAPSVPAEAALEDTPLHGSTPEPALPVVTAPLHHGLLMSRTVKSMLPSPETLLACPPATHTIGYSEPAKGGFRGTPRKGRPLLPLS